MRISDWSSDVCSSDLLRFAHEQDTLAVPTRLAVVGAPGAWATNPETGIDWVRLLHGEHRMTFDAPVPAQASVTSKTRVTHVVDKGADKGALVVTTRDVFDAGSGQPLATIEHVRSEEHTSELQSLMRISSAVFCLKKKTSY